METMYLLIGAGLTANRAARILRQKDPDGDVLLVGVEPHPPYDRPPLSKDFLRGETSREQLIYDTREDLEARGVRLITGQRVERLDTDKKIVHLTDGRTIAFHRALIATGGRPAILDLPGHDLEGVCYLRTMDDAGALAEAATRAECVVIVGAGFIGMEAAASFRQLGLEVDVVETAPRVWARFADDELSGFFRSYCERRGVRFHTGTRAVAFRGADRVSGVELATGQTLSADLVLVAVGIVPNTELAEAAGLDVDDGIVVDRQLRTSHAEIYAGGDVARYPDAIFGTHRRVEHWGHAEYCGQIAGWNMAGAEKPYAFLTYVWSDVFDLHLEFAGDESRRDRSLIRGSPADGRFTVLYLEDERLTAYFAVNGNPKEFTTLQKLIKRRVELRGREEILTDPETSLKELL